MEMIKDVESKLQLLEDKFIKMPHFDPRTDEEIMQARHDVQPKNTLNADKKWETVFKDFLEANDMNENFYTFHKETLNNWLSKLWFRARQKQTKQEIEGNLPGKRYRANSLKSMLYAINRLLQKNECHFNIISSKKFIPCQRRCDERIKEIRLWICQKPQRNYRTR